jgi:YidC/Oxa1 family membrane protein insertase
MNPFTLIVSEILYRPVFNIIVVFLGLFGANLGWAIVCMTIVVRLLLLKPSMAGAQMQQSMGGLQPKMQEVQEKYKDDPKKLSEETMKLLKKEGAGPLKGCMSMLIQIPVFIGLFFVIRHIAADTIPGDWLYSFFVSFGS